MSTVQWIAFFVVVYALGFLLAFALELRRRARHLRKHPDWRPGDMGHTLEERRST